MLDQLRNLLYAERGILVNLAPSPVPLLYLTELLEPIVFTEFPLTVIQGHRSSHAKVFLQNVRDLPLTVFIENSILIVPKDAQNEPVNDRPVIKEKQGKHPLDLS